MFRLVSEFAQRHWLGLASGHTGRRLRRLDRVDGRA